MEVNITKIEKVITFLQILLPKGPWPRPAFLLKRMIKKWQKSVRKTHWYQTETFFFIMRRFSGELERK